jgi:hypothetical protein
MRAFAMVDADEPWDDIERDVNALYEIIGRLVVEYARAEAYVHFLACRVLGSDYAGRVVFSGMRLGDLAERIRGMLRTGRAFAPSYKPTEQDYTDIDACLTQLALIGQARQKMAHRFVEMGPDQIRTHNLYTSKTLDSGETDIFERDQIQRMIADCVRIRRRILRHTDGEARRRERHDPDWLPALFAPWRYTPPPPNPPKEDDRPKGPRRKNPPDASRR